jgi:lysophospholipase L1-like esterase
MATGILPRAMFVIVSIAAQLLCTDPVAQAKQRGLGGNSPAPPMLNCGPFTNSNLPKPTPQLDPHATERFELINRAVRSEPKTILFVGDSLTEKWDPVLSQLHFAGRDALNAGVNGDRTENLLWRLEHGNLDGPSPKAVVVLIGTNDVGRNRAPEIIAEGVRANLMVLRSHVPNARILLLGLLPRSESPASPRRLQVSHVNRLIQNCRDDEHIFYADVGDALLNAEGRLLPTISPDGVHLSQPGYAALTARLDSELGRILATER